MNSVSDPLECFIAFSNDVLEYHGFGTSLFALSDEIVGNLINCAEFGVVEVTNEVIKLLPECCLHGEGSVPVCRPNLIASVSELLSILLLLPLLRDLRDDSKYSANSGNDTPGQPGKDAQAGAPGRELVERPFHQRRRAGAARKPHPPKGVTEQ